MSHYNVRVLNAPSLHRSEEKLHGDDRVWKSRKGIKSVSVTPISLGFALKLPHSRGGTVDILEER